MVKAVEAARVVVEHYNELVWEMKVECSEHLVGDMMNKGVEWGCSGQGVEKARAVVERCSKLVEEEVGVKVKVGSIQYMEEGVEVMGWDTLHMEEEEVVGVKEWDILHMGEEEK